MYLFTLDIFTLLPRLSVYNSKMGINKIKVKIRRNLLDLQMWKRKQQWLWMMYRRRKWEINGVRGARVRPWCWEVAGPWTTAAWFTTPAVPPHRVCRWRSDGGSVSPLGGRQVVPPRCHPPSPKGYRVSSASSSRCYLRFICGSCEKKKKKKKNMQMRIRGNHSRWAETGRREGTFSFLLWCTHQQSRHETFWGFVPYLSTPARRWTTHSPPLQ